LRRGLCSEQAQHSTLEAWSEADSLRVGQEDPEDLDLSLNEGDQESFNLHFALQPLERKCIVATPGNAGLGANCHYMNLGPADMLARNLNNSPQRAQTISRPGNNRHCLPWPISAVWRGIQPLLISLG
jgi:hypothetical protein